MKTTTASPDAPPSAPPTPGLVIWAYLLLGAGALVLSYCAFFLSTSVTDPSTGAPVTNLGLVYNHLIAVLAGMALGFTGALCAIAQALRSPATKPSAKALPIPSAASAPAPPESQPRSVRGELQQGRRRR